MTRSIPLCDWPSVSAESRLRSHSLKLKQHWRNKYLNNGIYSELMDEKKWTLCWCKWLSTQSLCSRIIVSFSLRANLIFLLFLKRKHIRVFGQCTHSYEMWLTKSASMFYHQVFSNKLGTDFRWLDLSVQWFSTVRAKWRLEGTLILRNKLPI